MRKVTLALFIVFVTFTLIQTPSIFADQIDIQSILVLYETVNKFQGQAVQQELIEQVKNIVYELDLQIPPNP